MKVALFVLFLAASAVAPRADASCQTGEHCLAPDAAVAPGTCAIGGPCGAKSGDNLAGAAFGAALVAGSVWWKRRAAKSN